MSIVGRAKNSKRDFLVMHSAIVKSMRDSDFSFQEIADFLYEKYGVRVSSITVSRFLKANLFS